jgi:hypothetical protein
MLQLKNQKKIKKFKKVLECTRKFQKTLVGYIKFKYLKNGREVSENI